MARLIDHTLLRPEAARPDIVRLCQEGLAFAFATVCVNPWWVPEAAARLAGSPVGVCAVVGFPLGALPPALKRQEAAAVLGDGASEVDMVVNLGAVKSGEWPVVCAEIEAVVAEAARHGALVKVILETALLGLEEKIAVALVARGAGASFVKTSTGFGPGGATVDDVRLLRRVVGSAMGVKASGGIRDASHAAALLDAGATRLGTSAGMVIVREWEVAQGRSQ
ncbi:MAG: deoxyribose-phosphate aldolase [Acidobacteriota bacterium]|nr:deoxyribose-phosphate aldolase [Acidobacteriota bacterium]